MSPGLIAGLLGAALATFLITRIFFGLSKSWPDSLKKICFVYSVSLMAIVLLAGYGMADGGDFAGAQALATYGPFVVLYLLIDISRHWKRQRAAQ